jgi:pimeloyl-ACP methyl ester carboxylesterase
MSDVTPFRIEVSDDELRDLRDRLRRTRWPDRETVEDWSQGTPLAFAQDLCTYWAEKYDWRATEARLNTFPQFRTEIDGLNVHFLHVRSPHEYAMPLVITHGWPGSIVEFHKVIAPLTDPTAHGGKAEDAFHVVAPSLPGYGFSDKPTSTGWGVDRIAGAWSALMARLGYERYGAQGGDWGSMVTSYIGLHDVDHVAGIHLNMPVVIPASPGEPTDEEKAGLARFAEYQEVDSGYSKQQSTRPQSVGYGLVDSPAGQCAWIVEKFWKWTDCDGDPYNVLTRDELLDNVMLYWIPGTGASSARLYWESFKALNFDPVTLPVGCSIFPKELFIPSKRWCEQRFPDLRWYNRLDKGGHFAAFEQPEIFVDEVRSFFRTVR